MVAEAAMLSATSPRDSASDKMPLNDASTFFAIALDSLVDAFGNLGADLVAECDRFFSDGEGLDVALTTDFVFMHPSLFDLAV